MHYSLSTVNYVVCPILGNFAFVPSSGICMHYIVLQHSKHQTYCPLQITRHVQQMNDVQDPEITRTVNSEVFPEWYCECWSKTIPDSDKELGAGIPSLST